MEPLLALCVDLTGEEKEQTGAGQSGTSVLVHYSTAWYVGSKIRTSPDHLPGSRQHTRDHAPEYEIIYSHDYSLRPGYKATSR